MCARLSRFANPPATSRKQVMTTLINPSLIILRRSEVERATGLSRSTIYARIGDGTFPPPVALGPRAVGWRLVDIEAFLRAPADYCAVEER